MLDGCLATGWLDYCFEKPVLARSGPVVGKWKVPAVASTPYGGHHSAGSAGFGEGKDWGTGGVGISRLADLPMRCVLVPDP